ncbi:histidine phosphotransferase family protein [Rhodobacteraceae bacterium]|nr:histidine phosphotransferase family protein [Paracoccaceae bacterium]
MNELELNALVGSRICHDLISPLGAIGNGVELLSMSGVGAAPEMTLISESVNSANARIRFFRIAYGAAKSDSMIGTPELKGVLNDLYRGNRLTVDWRITGDVPRIEAKLAFLLLQCMESAFPWGGKTQVTRSGVTWNIFGQTERMKIDTPYWDLLVDGGKTVDVTASNVHFALIQPSARQVGRRVTTNITESSLSISF